MKLETSNLLTETLAFLASKPFHYGEEDIFQLTESAEHGTFQKHGNSYSLSLGGIRVELKPQPAKRMWDRYSKKSESEVSEEQAKKIATRRQALINVRKLYKINKEKEQMIIACGDFSNNKQELYVMIFETPTHGNVLAALHIDYRGDKQIKSQMFYSQLEELSNYAIKRDVVLDKRLDKRGSGSKDNVGRNKKEVEE
ncbi:hypothetical protein MM182_18915 [Aeromonas sp. MR19]|uniref:hypothetical protein n=1 Tax=Aeromonas sp. MR19 TaxID=2923421 RepID=UPI001F4BCC2D|nr:hypothetical protein [Aeromonas sp. MR19]MCH7377427.1 hypothetical protein [Aeromonas sp. MR19]